MLFRRQATEERDEHIDMTPMVDVVFQLMTFMLFSVQMTGSDAVEVPRARNGIGVEEDRATFISMTKPDANGEVRVLLGNGEGPVAGPDEVRDYITKGLRENKTKVILQADGDVPHSEVLRVAGDVTSVEGVTLHIGVQEPE